MSEERHLYADGSTNEERARVGIDDPTDRAHLVVHLDPAQARRLMRELATWNEHNAGLPTKFSFQTVGDLERGDAHEVWLSTRESRVKTMRGEIDRLKDALRRILAISSDRQRFVMRGALGWAEAEQVARKALKDGA